MGPGGIGQRSAWRGGRSELLLPPLARGQDEDEDEDKDEDSSLGTCMGLALGAGLCSGQRVRGARQRAGCRQSPRRAAPKGDGSSWVSPARVALTPPLPSVVVPSGSPSPTLLAAAPLGAAPRSKAALSPFPLQHSRGSKSYLKHFFFGGGR